MGIVCLPGPVGKGFVAGQPGRRQSGGDGGAAGGGKEPGAGGAPAVLVIRCQVRQVVSASTPPGLASPTSMRPATRHCVILRGPHLQGRVRPRRVRRLGRHADEASGHAVSRPAASLPCNLSFSATHSGRSSRRGFVASSAERFVGSRARRVSHQAVRWVGRRAAAGRGGGGAQVGEDLLDDRRPLDHGDHLHRILSLTENVPHI